MITSVPVGGGAVRAAPRRGAHGELHDGAGGLVPAADAQDPRVGHLPDAAGVPAAGAWLVRGRDRAAGLPRSGGRGGDGGGPDRGGPEDHLHDRPRPALPPAGALRSVHHGLCRHVPERSDERRAGGVPDVRQRVGIGGIECPP
eukprot:1186603-Prorocentrum_minimum.AAC.4